MLYTLFDYLYSHIHSLSFMRLFTYITFRAILAAITAFLLSLLFGPPIIRMLKKRRIKDIAWNYGVVDVQAKDGTPTMGGLLILFSIGVASLLWCDLSNRFVHILFGAFVWFGGMGALDDYLKSHRNSKEGLKEHYKYALQLGFGVILSILYLHPSLTPVDPNFATELHLPFLKTPIANLGMYYSLLILFTITAISNSVNLADGLDGLAIVPSFLIAGVYAIFAYVIGNILLSSHFLFRYLPGSGEIAVFCGSIFGAGIGFLWFNAYPALIFMGDIGSLSLGGMLGTIAVLIKQEFLFIIAGGIFVAEAASVLIQKYIYIPFVGRRLFYRTPLHHTFQHRGYAETKVVIRFWIVSAIFALISLAALKIR